MNPNDFVTFQKFTVRDEAHLLKANLETADIECILEDSSASFDLTFAGNSYGDEFLLKVRAKDFERANGVLQAQAEAVVDSFGSDHYLHAFSDQELLEVLEKMDEWSKEDAILARKILATRGQNVSDAQLEEIRASRLEALRKPESGKKSLIIFGYIAALLGGILGVFIGWVFWTTTKIDPTGNRHYLYDAQTRREGKIIFWIGLICSAMALALLIWKRV